MKNTKLYMLTEKSPFMMSFVFITDGGNAVVIDGGRPADMPQLFDIIGSRPIEAWLLTHPHMDHLSGLVSELERGEHLSQIRNIYHNFPSAEYIIHCEPDEEHTILDFERVLSKAAERVTRVMPGSSICVDELMIDVMFCGGERYERPKPNMAINESSSVFRVTSPELRSVLFLGDLGPEGGRDLLNEYGNRLKSDIVQMAHHGHSGVGYDVYNAISPQACMWCTPDWLWDEADIEFEPELWGTKHQRAWMEQLNVAEHYISKDGIQQIPL